MTNRYFYSFLSAIVICFWAATANVRAAVNCSGLDITIDDVTLTGVGGGQISYNVTIHNVGTQDILFSKLTIKNYVSTDNTYDAGDTDGGQALFSTFVSSGTLVSSGQTYTTTYHANYSGSITSWPYLILQLSYQDGECDVTNNQMVVCTKPQPSYVSLYITSIVGNQGTFDVQIQNTGGDTLFLNKTIIQNYVSTDNTYGGGDPAAGGSILNTNGYVLANETYSVTGFTFNQSSLSSYSYLIAQLSSTLSTCSGTDQWITPLTVTAVTDPETEPTSVIWDMVNQRFYTSDLWTGEISYQLLDVSGRLLVSGKSMPGQWVALPGESGIALLRISDNQNQRTIKIMR